MVSFLLLALTRRIGFLVLWGLLLALWLSQLSDVYVSMSDVPEWFIAWTVVALPLYIIGMFAAPSPTSRVGLKAVVSGAILWSVLLAGAIGYTFIYFSAFEDPTWLDAAARFAWVPAPFVLAALAITGIWVGTREHSS